MQLGVDRAAQVGDTHQVALARRGAALVTCGTWVYDGLLRRALVAAVVIVFCACMPSAAGAQETAALHAYFAPDKLGVPTTIGFSFELSTSGGLAPPPLSRIDLYMPAGMNYTRTTLGLALCSFAQLEAGGAAACPPNSRLGQGDAFVEVPFGTGSGRELPTIEAFMGPPVKGNMVVLFYANGQAPVYAQLVFGGELLPLTGMFGSDLGTPVPPIPSVPGGPDVSIVKVSATIGPQNVTYFRNEGARTGPFHPRGVAIPMRCPAGGFPFSASFTFIEGGHATASTKVPCPTTKASRRKI